MHVSVPNSNLFFIVVSLWSIALLQLAESYDAESYVMGAPTPLSPMAENAIGTGVGMGSMMVGQKLATNIAQGLGGIEDDDFDDWKNKEMNSKDWVAEADKSTPELDETLQMEQDQKDGLDVTGDDLNDDSGDDDSGGDDSGGDDSGDDGSADDGSADDGSSDASAGGGDSTADTASGDGTPPTDGSDQGDGSQ